MFRNTASARRPDYEQEAIKHLIAMFAERGVRVTIAGRPDEANRTTRDVDFLIEADGRAVAVEVVRLAQALDLRVQLAEIERAVQVEIAPTLSKESLGWAVLDLRLLERVRTSDIPSLAHGIAASALEVLRAHAGAESPWDAEVGPIARSISARIAHRVGQRDRLTIVAWQPGVSRNIDQRTSGFVEWLIERKASQTAGYDEVWLLVVDLEILIDARNLLRALRTFAARIPPNWTRVYFIPAAGNGPIEEIDLRPLTAKSIVDTNPERS